MCLSPQYMTNRSRCFNKVSDRLLLKVPCGECEECKAQRINDWITRLYFEHKYTERLGGFVCFPTFTFDDAHLPYINLLHPYKQVNGKPQLHIHHGINSGDVVDTYHPIAKHPEYMSCVDRELWHKFTNSLKTYFDRIGYVVKWFYCWQYGETYGRVHIHAKIHLYPKQQHETSDSHNRRTSTSYYLNPQAFFDYLQAHWKHGNVSASSLGFVLTDANRSSRYVSRYAVRDTSWETEFADKSDRYLRMYDKIMQQYNDSLNNGLPLSDTIRRKKDQFKFFVPLSKKDERVIRPFVYSSANMGVSTILYQTSDDIKNEKVTLPKNDSFVSVSLPLYLKRKYFYNVDDELRYKLSTSPKDIYFEALPKRTAKMSDAEYNYKLSQLHVLTSAPSGVDIFPIKIQNSIDSTASAFSRTFSQITTIGESNGLSLTNDSIDAISRIFKTHTLNELEIKRRCLDMFNHLDNLYPLAPSRSLAIYSVCYRGFLDEPMKGHVDIDTYYFYADDMIQERIKSMLHRTYQADNEGIDTLGTDDQIMEIDDNGNVLRKINILTTEDAHKRTAQLLPMLYDNHFSFLGFNDIIDVLNVIQLQVREFEIKKRQKEFREKQALKDWRNRLKYNNEKK